MSKPTRVPLSEPLLTGNARGYVNECFDTNFVSSVGPFVDRFEREFAQYVGSRFAVAASTGTAAIHIALRLLGVKQGDEVPVSTLTFIASANPIAYEAATPLLVDAEPRTWNFDSELLANELERRARSGARLPKVVEVVHILGQPAELEPLVEVCARYDITLIEDAAEALGARYVAGKFAGKHVGTIGRLGCFSFNGNKIITTGGGGMIVTDDEALAKRAKHLTTQARLPGVEYLHDEVGYNYRLTNMAAALGVGQLEQLPTFVKTKRRIAETYDAAFDGMKGISCPPRRSDAEATYWLYSIRIDAGVAGFDRKQALDALRAQNIESRPIWTPLHTTAVFKGAPALGGSVADKLFAECLSIPSSVGLTEDDQHRVIDTIQKLHVLTRR